MSVGAYTAIRNNSNSQPDMTTRLLHTTLALLSLLLLGGCHPMVYEQLDDCPRELEVSLYSQSPCEAQPTYPEDMTSVLLIAYNDRGEVVATETHKGAVTAETRVHMTLPTSDPVRISAWSGLDEETFDLTTGARADELFAALRAGRDLTGRMIRQGVTERLLLPALEKRGTESPTQVSVNLLQLTNRITIRLSGLQEPEKVSMEVTSANDRYSGLGKLLDVRGQSTPYSYPVAIERKANTYTGKPEPGCIAEYDGEVTGIVTTLSMESGHGSLLSIHQEGLSAPIYEADLVGLVLMAARKGAQHANLSCDHDFTVDLKVRRCPDCSEGYEVAWIKVNDWLVHSLDIELDKL